MSPDEMLAVYQRHRAAEDARDFPRVIETLTPDCFLEHVSLGLRSEGRDDATRAYGELFGAFPDLGPIPGGGERLFYDAATLCDQVGLDIHELRAAAACADA